MRRYTFYLSVALLAFGIGSFVVFKFFWKVENSLLKVQLTEDFQVKVINNPLENKKTKQPKFVEIGFKNIPCEDADLKPFWNELKDRTVSINTDYLERIKDCSNLIQIDESVDLNSDGRKEVFIRGESGYFCGNNCQVFWIFQQDKEKGLRKLFEQMGYMPLVKNTKTKGYRDIMFEVYASYLYSDIKFYKFNGMEYVQTSVCQKTNCIKIKAEKWLKGKAIKPNITNVKKQNGCDGINKLGKTFIIC